MARSSFNGSYMRWNYLLMFIWQSFCSRNNASDTHISVSIRVRTAPVALLSVLLTTARWALCVHHGFCLCCAVRETNPDWMARSVFSADALIGASIIAFLPHGQLKMQNLRNRSPCVIRSCRQKQLWWMRPGGPQTSAVTNTRDAALDLLWGFWDRSKN